MLVLDTRKEKQTSVSDDLVITPMNSSLTISLLSKLQLSIDDIEEHLTLAKMRYVEHLSILLDKIFHFCFESASGCRQPACLGHPH